MAMSVLNMLMGGGGSFSPGGPGKGMYTRLYQDALARFNWISHISCNHSIFEDTGLFCYYGTSQPEHAGRLVDVMVSFFLLLQNKFVSSFLFVSGAVEDGWMVD